MDKPILKQRKHIMIMEKIKKAVGKGNAFIFSTDYIVLREFDEIKADIIDNHNLHEVSTGGISEETIVMQPSTPLNIVTHRITDFLGNDEISPSNMTDLVFVTKGLRRYYLDADFNLRYVTDLSSVGEHMVAKLTGCLVNNDLVICTPEYKYEYNSVTGTRMVVTKSRRILTALDSVVITKTEYTFEELNDEEPGPGYYPFEINTLCSRGNVISKKSGRKVAYVTGTLFIFIILIENVSIYSEVMYRIEGKKYDYETTVQHV